MTGGPPPSLPSLITLNRALLGQQLLRGVAHELRNNLQVVALGSSLGIDGQTGAVAARVDRSLDEMVGTLELLSHLGRAAGAEPLATDLGEAFDEVRTFADLQRNVPILRLSVEPPSEPTTVLVQKGAIHQMLLNLITNAKEASERATDAVSLTVTMPMEGRVAILVTDAGPGMPTLAGSLFYSTKNRNCHGGIGLFVTRALADAHGGELTWGPGPSGGGTTARLVLPISGPG